MRTRILNLLCAVTAAALSGCATTDNNVAEMYEPHQPGFKRARVPVSSVKMIALPLTKNTRAQAVKALKPYADRGYIELGKATFSGRAITEQELRKFAASVGGDLVFYTGTFAGTEQQSRMVVGSYTPSRVAYSSGSSYGSSYGSANTYGSTPWGAMNFNTSGSGTSYGTASATTFIPGSTTYVRENYEVPVFMQHFKIFQSPQAQLNNWENYRRYSNTLPGEPISIDQSKKFAADFANTYGLQLPARLRPKAAPAVAAN